MDFTLSPIRSHLQNYRLYEFKTTSHKSFRFSKGSGCQELPPWLLTQVSWSAASRRRPPRFGWGPCLSWEPACPDPSPLSLQDVDRVCNRQGSWTAPHNEAASPVCPKELFIFPPNFRMFSVFQDVNKVWSTVLWNAHEHQQYSHAKLAVSAQEIRLSSHRIILAFCLNLRGTEWTCLSSSHYNDIAQLYVLAARWNF